MRRVTGRRRGAEENQVQQLPTNYKFSLFYKFDFIFNYYIKFCMKLLINSNFAGTNILS
jgi:hypothetical protein